MVASCIPSCLLLLVLVVTAVSGASVGVLDYVIPIPNLFNGSTDNGTGCNPTSGGDSLDCFDFNMNNHTLVDGDTGPLHSLSSTNLYRFLAWNRTQTQPVTLKFGFQSAVSSLSSVVLYFFNYPTQQISLPSVTLRGSIKSTGDPFFEISNVYSNNDVLINSDSQLRNVSLSITSNTDNIQLLFIDLVFTNTDINWILLSEVDICEGLPNSSPVFEPVTFQAEGQSETVTLGPNSPQSSVRLSCTVTVSGSFQWTWQHNGDSLLSSECYQILTGDATRSSILVINKLNYTDEGTYSCVVNHVSQTERSSQNFTLQLLTAINATAKQISVREGEAVSVSCEMYGYLRGEIKWVKDGQQVQSGGRYNITVSAGSREGQDGGQSSVSSVVSQLTIQQVEQGDEGTYTCTAVGTALQDTVYINVTESMPASSPVAAIAAVAVVVVVVLVVVIAIVVILIVCLHHKSNKTTAVVSLSPVGDSKFTDVRETNFENPEVVGGDYTYSVVDKTPPTIPPQKFVEDNEKKTAADRRGSCLEWNKNAKPKLAKVTNTKNLILKSNPLYESAEHTPPAISEPYYSSVPETVEGNAVPIYSVPDQPNSINQPAVDDYSSDSLLSPIYTAPDLACPLYAAPDMTKKHRPPLEITSDNIREVREIGYGQFGEVMLAETVGLSLKDLRYSTTDDDKTCTVPVALKRIRSDADPSAMEAFKKEMKFVSQLNHSNVVRLLAISNSATPFMVMEYMEKGDLNQFLRKAEYSNTDPPLSSNDVSSSILLSMTIQLADGMAYLARHNFIHRDLATRNVLVGDNYTVKLSDFGLSRNLYESAYYVVKGRAKMPVRWMSWECFYGKFSEKSDVWAYGITVWEIFSLCQDNPYSHLTDREVVDDALKAAKRTILDKPSLCPDKLYKIILNMSWASETSERATFQELFNTLDELTRDGLVM